MGAAREGLEHRFGFGRVRRLAEQLAVAGSPRCRRRARAGRRRPRSAPCPPRARAARCPVPRRSRARRRRTGSAAAPGSRAAAATSTRGRADRRSSPAGDPDLLAGPLLRPVGGDVRVVLVRLGVGGRLDLDQPLDLEAVRAQQVDPLAVREVELDADPSGHSKRCMPNCGAGRGAPSPAPSSSEQRIDERRVAEEDEPPAGPQEPSRLGDPAVRIDPDRRAVLGDDEVDARVRQAGRRRRRPRPAGTRSPSPPACRRAVSSCAGVMSTPTGRAPSLREPGREVGGAAAELDDVEPGDVAEDVQLGLVDRPRCPTRSRRAPSSSRRSRRCTRRSTSVQCAAFVAASLTTSPSGNQIPISRSADSGESEPCTRLFGIASANSPRRLPGSASAGFVAPIVLRHVAIAPSPSRTNASVGPEVMKSTSSPKNGFSVCSA